MVHHEGLLELDAIYLFEASPRIVRYREQPLQIRYPDGARLRRYTPDFELVLSTGEIVLIEVKPLRSLEDEEIRHKLDCIADHLRRSGQIFVILTDACLRLEPRQSNLRWVYHQASRVPPSAEAGRTIVRHHCYRFPLLIREAIALFGASGVDPYSLLMAGQLSCGLGETLSLDTHITPATEADDAWFWITREYGF